MKWEVDEEDLEDLPKSALNKGMIKCTKVERTILDDIEWEIETWNVKHESYEPWKRMKRSIIDEISLSGSSQSS